MFVQGIIGKIISVISFTVLAHRLPPEEMGVYAILVFILGLAATLGTLALSTASTKYIAQYLAEGKPEKATSVVARVLQITLLTSAVSSILLFVCAGWLSKLLWGTPVLIFLVLAFDSFFTILFPQVASFLQGSQRIREVAAVLFIFDVSEDFVAIYLLISGWGLLSVVIGWLVGHIVSFFVGLILTARFIGVLGKPHPLRTLVNFSYPLYLTGVITFAADWLSQLFIIPYLGPYYLGIYSVAVQASLVPSLIMKSARIPLFPQLSELHTQYGTEGLRQAFHIATRYATLFAFPVTVGLTALAHPIIVLFAGARYAEAVLPLTILCPAMLLTTLQVATRATLWTLERTKTDATITIVSILSQTVICYVALAHLNLGVLGAAWASTIASFIEFVLITHTLRKTINIAFDAEALWKASVASIVMAVIIVLSRSLESLIFYAYLLPFQVVLGAAVYFFSLVILRAIRKEDVELMRAYLPNGLKWVADWLGRVAFVK